MNIIMKEKIQNIISLIIICVKCVITKERKIGKLCTQYLSMIGIAMKFEKIYGIKIAQMKMTKQH